MPTTRKPRFTGRGAGAKQPSGTYRKPKGPETHGPGLRELEQLAGRQEAIRSLAKAVLTPEEQSRLIEAQSRKMMDAMGIAEAALSNPRPLPKRKRSTYMPAFGYRVVRRYDKHGNKWLELSDVIFDKGRPMSFGLMPATLTAQQTNVIMDISDAEALDVLRQKHELILAAFSQPILDEKTDFGRISICP